MEYTIDEWIEKEPYFKLLSNFILFLDKETIDSFQNDEKVNGISIKLLKNIISNDKYYHYVEKLFNNELEMFEYCYIINGDTSRSVKLTKKEIILSITQALEKNLFILDKKELTRFNKLHNKINYDKFIDDFKDTTIDVNIDKQNISIPFNSIITFLELKEDEYQEFLTQENNSIIDIKKEYFVYIILDFFTNNKILEKYIIPEQISNKIMNLKHDNIIDIEAINQYIEPNENLIKQIEINHELKNTILNKIPNNFNLLEKAIYIYIKLCKTLKYDSEIYSENQTGISLEKHKDINRLKNITETNNEIVCHEINAIYAKLLDELNIKLKIMRSHPHLYGEGHANLIFRVDKFLIQADTLAYILTGDLIRAKLNYPLTGLKCKNKNKKTKKEFYELVSKVYKIIALEEKETINKNIEKKETFDDILSEYKNTTSNEIYLDTNEKFDLLMTKLTDSCLFGMDALSYILMLKKIIFDMNERQNNINISIIKNNELSNNDIISQPSAIITLNSINIDNTESNNYYLYIPSQPLYYISLNDLRKKFRNGDYEYIKNNQQNNIPGITNEKGNSK